MFVVIIEFHIGFDGIFAEQPPPFPSHPQGHPPKTRMNPGLPQLR
jgi:hypothetical protein